MEILEQSSRIARYPTYKDTGIEWLQELPAHWRIRKGKWLFVKQERPPRKEDDIVTCFRDGQVTLRSNRKTEGFTNALKEHGYQGIRKGDLVIHNMDAFAGAIGISDSEGKSTPVYSACTPKSESAVDSHYYAYLLRNLAKTGFIESLAKGIRERSTDFRFNDFGVLLLPVPPKPEQTLIARFLDRKTAQIDNAIAQKEKLIELLKERRQILIHNAVTKGLNPNVKMKDSAVEWIGEIPEHWEVRQLRRLFSFLNTKRIPISAEEREKMGGIYPYYGASGIIDYVNDYIFDEPLILIAEDGANLLSKSTPLAFVASGKYWVNNHAHILKPAFPGFTYWSELLSAVDYTTSISGAAQPKLTMDRLASIKLPLPPEEELSEISSDIERISLAITDAMSLMQREIEKLLEYKATLINSTVTGKIKVPDLETID